MYLPVTERANTDEVARVKRQCLLLQFISPLGKTAEVVSVFAQCHPTLQLAHLTQRMLP
ncbi:MAG: hypothetical protein K2H96_03680 [Muribaculaceae bacterium]|nr:hypothetical protein [Muribaculaceae bacterium]